MYFTSAEIQIIDESRLESFLEKQIPENHHLDYKEQLSRGKNDREWRDAKREFLKDITAFANANGGDIIIGAKEPKEKLAVNDQLKGIEDGDNLAKDLERVASSSLDPRIPGLLIVPIRLKTGKYAIVVHIPPSISRPYRVNHSGFVNFFTRHNESSDSMSTYEIREAVLSSASAEFRVKEYLSQAEKDVEEYFTKGRTTFFLQAMPLIPPEQPWDVLHQPFLSIIRDSENKRQDLHPNLASSVKPTATLYGIIGRDDRKSPNWITEVHRNGYISVTSRDLVYEQEQETKKVKVIGTRSCDLFRSFTQFCAEIMDAAKNDSPYVLRCRLLWAKGIYLHTPRAFDHFHGPWERPKIEFPDQIRQVGEEFTSLADQWCEDLFHAFGLDSPL